MQVGEKLDAFNEWGSILALSYIAAQRTFPDYSDMAQAKAVLESIARSYGHRLGQTKKIRVNTISHLQLGPLQVRVFRDLMSFMIMRIKCLPWEMPLLRHVRIIVFHYSQTSPKWSPCKT